MQRSVNAFLKIHTFVYLYGAVVQRLRALSIPTCARRVDCTNCMRNLRILVAYVYMYIECLHVCIWFAKVQWRAPSGVKPRKVI